MINNQNITVTENGIYTADQGYTGLGTVTVEVPGSSVNAQSKTVYSSGTFTADEFPITYYSYDTTNVSSLEFHPKGNKLWAKSGADVGDVVYDSLDDEGTAPNFTKPIGSIIDSMNQGLSIYINIYNMSGTYLNRGVDTVTTAGNYNYLSSVTVDVGTIRAVGGGLSKNLHITTPIVINSAFFGCNGIETLVCDATDIGGNAFSNTNIRTATFTNYEGAKSIVNDETGYINFDNQTYYSDLSVIQTDGNLEVLNLPEVIILPGNFANNSVPFSYPGHEVSLEINAPKLEGILSGTALGSAYNWETSQHPYNIMKINNIDLMSMKYLGKYFGQVLEEYVSDSDNNITNTLTFQNLEYMGSFFTQVQGNNPSTSNLQNVTTISVPNLKCIVDAANLRFNITSLNLPKIEYIGDNLFDMSVASNITTINIGNTIKNIKSNAFANLNGVTINIDLPQPTGSETNWIADAPWGAQNATINWTGSAI